MRGGSLLRRWVPVPLGLALGVCVVELALRLAGAVWLEDRVAAGADPAAARTILCLGDSNTYGLHVAASGSYPGRLQALLDARVDGPRHRVVNLALPGMSSEDIVGRLPSALAEYRPDVVLVLSGINDRWKSAERGGAGAWSRPAWRELRVVQLLQVVGQRAAFAAGGAAPGAERGVTSYTDDAGRTVRTGRDRTGAEFEYWHGGEAEFLAVEEAEARSLANLRAIGAASEAAGARWALLTYAWDEGYLGEANDALRRSARALGAPLVDTARRVAAAIESVGPEALFFPDRHPKAAGYRLFARAVFNGLDELGWIPGAVERVADLERGLVRPGGSLHFARRDGEPGLEIAGEEPGRRLQVLLSFGGPGRRVRWHETELPLVDDELYAASRVHPALGAAADADGTAFVSLAPLRGLLAEHPKADRGVWAVYVVAGRTLQSVAHISNGVEIEAEALAAER